MAFRGSLAELPLTDILQLVAVSNKTGVLALRNGDAQGQIHIDRGQIVHATTGGLGGEQAFFEVARWSAGEFDFTQDAPISGRTIDKSNTNLLMEAARQIDEWKLLVKRIGSTRMVPVFAPRTSSSVSLSAAEWAVVSRVDERRNIEEIAAALGHSAFDVCKVIFGLLTSGALALREDLRRLPVDRVRRLSADEQFRLAGEIHDVALELLEGQERPPDLEGALRLFRAEHESGRAVDALTDLVRATEKAVSTTLGPHQARAFLDRVALILSRGDGERPAPRRSEAAPRAERRPLDLPALRQRLSELVYRGLGPDGESHVLRIEKARTVEELRQTAGACRELLRRLGRDEVAAQLGAELDNLA